MHQFSKQINFMVTDVIIIITFILFLETVNICCIVQIDKMFATRINKMFEF